MNQKLEIKGYTVFIVECANGSYFGDMARDLDKKLREINSGKGFFFKKHPERLPVRVVFKEENLIFQEAHVKFKYLRKMNRTQRKLMIKKNCWPRSKELMKLLEKREDLI